MRTGSERYLIQPLFLRAFNRRRALLNYNAQSTNLIQNRQPHGLTSHLYKCCVNVQEQYLDLHKDEDLGSIDFLKTLVEFVLPHVRVLSIESPGGGPLLESWKFRYLLDHCSSKLEDLSLYMDTPYDDNVGEQEQGQKESAPWSLEQLNLMRCGDKSD